VLDANSLACCLGSPMKAKSTRRPPRQRAPLPDRLSRQLEAVNLIAASRDHSHLPIDVYMLTAETIAARCDVDVATARRWKTGRSPIPYAAGVVLSGYLGGISRAWGGWRVLGDALITPDGERIAEADLVSAMRSAGEYGYSSIAQFAKELQKQLDDLQQQLGRRTGQGLEEQPPPPPTDSV